MKRRDFIKTTAAVITLSLLNPADLLEAASRKRLNLLFITVDDMNWSIPGFMGNTLGLTPNLDKLAARSHQFVHNRASAPICQPSREAMMTGRVPHRSGGLGFNPINEGIPTLVTTLKSAGYYTAAIHKIDHMQPQSCFPWDHMVKGKERKPSEYGSAVLEAIITARENNQPFFINCNINDPHRPFYGSAEAASVDHNEEGEYKVAREVNPSDIMLFPSNLDDIPDVRKEYSQYCNSAQRMDVSIGKVIEALESMPEASDTIIIFTADHGMPFPFAKATVYDNGTRTPALLSYPGMGKPKIFQERTCNIDYMPTLLDLLGVEQPGGMDGHSWVPLLHGEKYGGPELLVTHVNGVSSGAQFPMRAIQDDRYSLIFTPWSDGKLQFKVEPMSGLTYSAMVEAAKNNSPIKARVKQYIFGEPLAFYDLKKDPSQSNNIIDNPEHAERIEKMKKALRAYMVRTNDPQLENWDRFQSGQSMNVPQPQHINIWRTHMKD